MAMMMTMMVMMCIHLVESSNEEAGDYEEESTWEKLYKNNMIKNSDTSTNNHRDCWQNKSLLHKPFDQSQSCHTSSLYKIYDLDERYKISL